MMTSMRRPILLLALISLGLSSCGGLLDGDDPGPGGDPTDPPGIDHPSGPDQLVLRIDSGGGFVPPEFLLTDLPDLSLLGDGRLVVLGPQIEIYPGPALPNLQVRQLTEDGMQALLEAAREAGLFGPDAHYDNACVTDLPTTTFTLVAEGETHVISAYALGVGDQEEDNLDCVPSRADAAARRKLAEFQELAFGLDAWMPEGSVGPEQEFAFDELRLFVEPATFNSIGDQGIEPTVVDWPLDTPLADFGEPTPDAPAGERCGTVSGADLDVLMSDLREANQLTLWESDGQTYRLFLRPLLPDESGCPPA
jgi:hypothetical protein